MLSACGVPIICLPDSKDKPGSYNVIASRQKPNGSLQRADVMVINTRGLTKRRKMRRDATKLTTNLVRETIRKTVT